MARLENINCVFVKDIEGKENICFVSSQVCFFHILHLSKNNVLQFIQHPILSCQPFLTNTTMHHTFYSFPHLFLLSYSLSYLHQLHSAILHPSINSNYLLTIFSLPPSTNLFLSVGGILLGLLTTTYLPSKGRKTGK